MASNIIVTGDDVSLPVTLKKNGSTFTIEETATVEARVVSTSHSTPYAASVEQSSATPGADWANSLVVVELPSANTASITKTGTEALVEIQVDDNGKTTWFVSVDIVEGQIA